MNKLHTIGGLIQLDHKEKALDYLFQTMESRKEISSFLSRNIMNENVAGLLLGKIARGKELGIEVQIDRQSSLKEFPRHLDQHDVVVLVGNLIENAFDALSNKKGGKEIFISFEQDHEVFSLLVEDNGSGMDESTKLHLFERGFSTKVGEGRGIGLYLVYGIVQNSGGQIKVDSVHGVGTSFMLTFPMEDKGGEVNE
jgi:two-component system sensor histidine kinase DctS